MSDPSSDLRAIADRYWEAFLETHPTDATLHGDHRFDDRIEDVSVDAHARQRATWLELRALAEAIDPAALDPAGRVTRELLTAELTAAVESIDVRSIELRSDQNTALHAELFMVAPQVQAPTPAAAAALLDRQRQLPDLIGQFLDRLRAGLAAGRTPARICIERSLNQLDKYLAGPLDADPFTRLTGPPDWSGEGEWRASLADLARDVIRPAFARYREYFAAELLPAGRPDDRPGLCWLAEGEALYRHYVRSHTTLAPGDPDLDPEAIHRIGLDEIDRLAGEYAEVGGRLLGPSDVAGIFTRLRSDETLRYSSGDDIMRDARRYLAAATAAMGDWFGRLPVTPCDITPVPAAIAEDMPVAYYFPPADDGSRPGTYFVNTADPGHKNRFETASVAYHEAIPGHHLQLAIATELDGVPAFQRLALGNTAYVEGWGLYAERLAEEMGLYADDMERIGMLAADSWRSCRLVVDTGLHALGWSRDRAIDFMVANAPVSRGEIEVEVDRYIGMPGQALAYKIGQREILRLRAEAKERLGPAFDIRAFHDVVLGSSSVSLPVLRHMVEEWMAGAAA
ncbi:MAG TPA: DUF885 domain-containing protein [Acidimicrobiia bacterium]|nr:DUF885 domain-containing protein [Acidimicrobiia bacterium]